MTAFPLLRFAAIGVLAMSFALTACGRRGPLDPPPLSASSQPSPRQPQQAQSPQQLPQEQAAVDQGEDEFGNAAVPRGQKKPFPLDGLLN